MHRRPGPLRAAALLALTLCLAVSARAAEDEIVARVLIALGTVEAVAADGSVRDLARGDALREGETIRSGPRGRAQLRFTDGARMSLRPDTELSVDDYEFEETAPPQRSRSSMSLRRGGFRTATGRIADRNRSAYRVSTPFAVIGVRGTDWSAAIADLGRGENLFLGVDDGGIFARNDGGSIDLGACLDGSDPSTCGSFDFARIRSFVDAPEGLDSLPPQIRTTFSDLDLPPVPEDEGPEAPAGPAAAAPPDEGGPPADDAGGGPPGDDGGPPGSGDGVAITGGEDGAEVIEITDPIVAPGDGSGEDGEDPLLTIGIGCF